MTGKLTRPIRAVHCFQTQSEHDDNLNLTVVDLLELQNSNYYSELPKDTETQKPWDVSRSVLEVKLTAQCGYPLDAFQQIKQLATADVKSPLESGVLYAVLTLTDSLNPAAVPLRVACTLHLGGLIPWEVENDASCYELIAHAVDLFCTQRNLNPLLRIDPFNFVFQGELFYATATPLAGNRALVAVFDERDCERMQAVV